MNPIRHIRKTILDLSQDEFSDLVGVSQGTVSRWENGELEPDRAQLDVIRTHVIGLGLPWSDAWFFEAPASAEQAAS